jgi:hypothetical protein
LLEVKERHSERAHSCLKPVDDPVQAIWRAEVLDGLDVNASLRVIRPARSIDGG